LRHHGYHVLNLMSRRSKKKAGAGKAPPGRSSVSVRPAVEMPKGTIARPPEAGNPPADWPDHWMVPGVCIFLAAMVWVVFGQTLGFGFVNFDDNEYIYENPIVQEGLTFPGILWAFTHVWASNWHPLTWLSHMLDCQCYGLNAGGHHLTNVLLHMATVILLFLVLRRMTGCLWRSAFVAAVFAIHPLRVESVAWLAERKDVLSGLFFMLTLGAYVRYARHSRSPARYGLVVLWFALGLMCKPMLVTLPFVLLLLDYWPLNRLQTNAGTEPVYRLARRQIPRRLIFEKLPLLGLTVASCAITILAQTRVIQSSGNLSLCGLYGPDVLAVESGGCISVDRRGCQGCRSGAVAGGVGRHFDGSLYPPSPLPLSSHRLGMVSHHAAAGDWDSASGSAGAGGSLHLSAADRPVPAADLGGHRLVRSLALSPPGAGQRFSSHSGCFDFLCACTDGVLAEQRDTMDSHAGLHVEQFHCPRWPRQRTV
jgi:hypothetical protein